MNKYFSLIVSTLLVWAVTACKPVIKDEPEPQPAEDTTAVKDTTTAPEDTIPEPPQLPESFPRKHLIEEFTGQGCGYCPYGMNCVHSFMESDTNWVLILHHYGYQADHFSVTGSKTITTKLGVDGAPSVAIDRAATKSEAGTKICFHPGYLPSVSKSQFVATTYASVQIANDYSSADRTLRVHLSGYVLKDEHPDLLLTVMVKESGMIDTQQDYYYTYEGWQEFRHANAVRAYLTAATGDSLHVQDDKSWSADYELTLSSTWVPENCAVVAVIAEKFQPVIQAAQQPVVSGTQGGADILHGGITPVPIADYYPEPGNTISPSTYSGKDADTLTVAQAYYTPYTNYGFNYWEIQAYNTSKTLKVKNTTCLPFADIYLFTELSQKTIPEGTYELNTSMQPGTAYAGFRDDEHMQIDGSSFYYTSKSYFQQGYLVPSAQWLIVDGTLTITATGWSLTGHARNGSDIKLVGTKPISVEGRANAPQRVGASGAPQRMESCESIDDASQSFCPRRLR